MGVAVPRAPVGTRSPEPPQKFGHGPLFVGQLLSRNQVSQKIRVKPPPPPPPPLKFQMHIFYHIQILSYSNSLILNIMCKNKVYIHQYAINEKIIIKYKIIDFNAHILKYLSSSFYVNLPSELEEQ